MLTPDSANDRRRAIARILTMRTMQPMPEAQVAMPATQSGTGFIGMPPEFADPFAVSRANYQGHSPTSAFGESASSNFNAGAAGNMFSGGFDVFGGNNDPLDTDSPSPNGPLGAFGNNAPGLPTGTFSDMPLGDYTTTNSFQAPGFMTPQGSPIPEADPLTGGYPTGDIPTFNMPEFNGLPTAPGEQGASMGGWGGGIDFAGMGGGGCSGGGGLGAVGGTEGQGGTGDPSSGGVG